jgi:hypothetical protein
VAEVARVGWAVWGGYVKSRRVPEGAAAL